METTERRRAIMRMLCRRKSEIIENIAVEFGVSERTIRRDIEALSRTEPIYTKSGRYGGGVYVMEGYHADKFYFDNAQTTVLKKLLRYAEDGKRCWLSADELILFKELIATHTVR